jgi:TonB family protein
MALFLLLPMRSVHAQGQTTKQALKEFRGQILGNKLIVRGFSDDPITTFQWTGTGLSYSDPQLHTLGVLKADSVELQANKLVISGERTTLIRDKDGSFKLDGGAHAVIVVNLQGSAAAQVIPALKAALFFTTIQDGLAALPPEYASLISALPTPKDVSDASHVQKYKECPSEDQVFQRPSILYAPPAEFSEEAKQAHFSGNVTVKMTVGEDGLPHNLWIFKPAGLGLDQEAGQAASKYKFRPATCDGKPVKTTLYMDVNFKML